MRFIRKNGRIIPIRDKGEKPDMSKKAVNTRRAIVGTLAATSLTGYPALFGRDVSRSLAFTAINNAKRATMTPKSSAFREAFAESAVKQAKLSMKISKISSILGKASIATGLVGFGSAIGHRLSPNDSDKRRSGAIKGAATGASIGAAFFSRNKIINAFKNIKLKKSSIVKISGLLK